MHKMLSRCPVCAGTLHVTEIACNSCNTKIQSEFEACRFCRLSPDQLQFVELFLRSRGNLTSIGDELDISYPTVTRRLEAILVALALPDDLNTARADPPPVPPPDKPDPRDIDRRQILEMLDKGEITAEEATRQLKDL